MEKEFIFLVILVISGIIFFWGLEKSHKSTNKALKILCLLLSTICSVIMMEAIFRILDADKNNVDYSVAGTFFSNLSFYFFRVFQVLLILVGILMSLAIGLKEKIQT